ncbi:MAG: hypothetical protein HFE73_03980 [Firmicutes bacterium]|jgi:hypothetical protein|nr:hypothetical protein [Bacillota bacterium]
MKSKAPLMLIEQMIMLLVFALAAALCLRAFIVSDSISKQSIARDHAVVEAQKAAEALKGDYAEEYFAQMDASTAEQGVAYIIDYTTDWQPAGEHTPAYTLQALYTDSDLTYLNSAEITVCDQKGNELFRLPVSWQKLEVNENA